MMPEVREILDSAKAATAGLPAESLIRPRLTESFWREVEQVMGSATSGPIGSLYFPPIVLLLAESPIERVLAFEDDLRAVLAATPAETRPDLTSFLTGRDERRGPCTARGWCAGRFELSVKSRLLRSGMAVELDPPVGPAKGMNPKRADILVRLGERTAYVECTALTESDLDRARWDGEMEAWRDEGGPAFVGGGQVTDQDGLERRIFAKIFDKLAKGGDPAATQMPEGYLNVLALSVDTPTSVFSGQHHVLGWALDKLLTLHRWRLSAVLVFDRCRLVHARVNYNAARPSRMTHAEISGLEEALSLPPVWAE